MADENNQGAAEALEELEPAEIQMPLPAKTYKSGIRVALGASDNAWDEWIEFKHDLGWQERVDWDEAFDIPRMRLLIGWANNWRLKDKNNALIPFEKDALLKNIRAINISMPKVDQLVRAGYRAFAEARDLPLG